MRKSHAKFAQLPHLRALPAFAAAAQTGSLTVAAKQLHVTPGAVSRQIKVLEESLGVALFNRSHNAITLTEAGNRFLNHVNAALAMLDEGARSLNPQTSTLVVHAPITFARRWLIPRIRSFTELRPGTNIVIRSLALGSPDHADVSISYARTGSISPDRTVILDDTTIAVCAPRLLTMLGRETSGDSIMDLTLLLDTDDAWSWRKWCTAAGMTYLPRRGTISLDTDEASIDACLSGLGVAQANPAFVEGELRSGQLVALQPEIVAPVGCYFLERLPSSALGIEFRTWLEKSHF